MASIDTVVLSGQSLFAEGIASILRRSNKVNVAILDPGGLDVIPHIVEINPTAVILDTNDVATAKNRLVTTLIKALPNARIVLLETEKDQIQIVTGLQRDAACVNDLLEAICAPG